MIIKRLKNFIVKTFNIRKEENYWRFRHLFDRSWPLKYISEESITHPHRNFLLEIIGGKFPFSRVLEVGCSSGPNLYTLAKKFSQVNFFGVDISKKAIGDGKIFFDEKMIKNVFLSVSSADNLSAFSDKYFDVVFSDATLIYLGPEKISAAIGEMLRVAKKSIILLEWHTESDNSEYRDHWLHNYKKIFNDYNLLVQIRKLPEDKWQGDWIKYGYIIEANL